MRTILVLGGLVVLGIYLARRATMVKLRLIYVGGPKDGEVDEFYGGLSANHDLIPHPSGKGAWYYEKFGEMRMHEGAVEVRMKLIKMLPWDNRPAVADAACDVGEKWDCE